MPFFAEPELVSDDAAIWHKFDPSVKAELFSTAIATNEGICLVDPSPVDPAGLSQLQAKLSIHAIVVTNQNHWRASTNLARQLSVPIFAHGAAQLGDFEHTFVAVADGERIGRSLEVIAIEGAAAGEIALLSESGAGTLIVGDALINFEPYGFTLLPSKYCLDHRKMKKSLSRLLDHSFDRMFFAHGLPIMSGARSRLDALLSAE